MEECEQQKLDKEEEEEELEETDIDEDDDSSSCPADRRLLVNGLQFEQYKKRYESRPRRSLFFLPVLDPLGKAVFIWAAITTVVDLSYTAFIVPLSLAFQPPMMIGAGRQFSFLMVFDFIGNWVYFIDWFMGFHTGFVACWDARWVPVTDGRLVAKYYALHGQLVINTVAMLPLIVQIALLASDNNDQSALQLVYLLRLLRLTRVVKVFSALSRPAERRSTRFLVGWVSATRMLVFTALLSLLMLLNLLGCVWWTIAVWEGLENSWAAHVGGKEIDLTTASNPTRYLYSVYYVMTTITTIGYGDITPYSPVEMGVAMCYMLIGVFYFGYLINVVSEVFSASQPSKANAALNEKMQGLEAWMSDRQLPAKLRRALRTHFINTWMADSESPEASFYTMLPSELKRQVRRQLTSPSLAHCNLFSGLSKASKDRLEGIIASVAVPLSLFPKHVLYDKGDEARHFYILDEGTMSESSRSVWSEVHINGPALVGLAAMFGAHVPECATRGMALTAVTGCHLWSVDCSEVERCLSARHADVLLELTQFYLKRVRGLLARTPQADSAAMRSLRRRLGKAAAGLEQRVAELEVEVQRQKQRRAGSHHLNSTLMQVAASKGELEESMAGSPALSPGAMLSGASLATLPTATSNDTCLTVDPSMVRVMPDSQRELLSQLELLDVVKAGEPC